MPKCCIPTQIVFSNAESTTVTYDQAMRDKYGVQPKVYVYYYDPVANEYYLSPWYTVMKFNGSQITVDHGGPSSGMLVIT